LFCGNTRHRKMLSVPVWRLRDRHPRCSRRRCSCGRSSRTVPRAGGGVLRGGDVEPGVKRVVRKPAVGDFLIPARHTLIERRIHLPCEVAIGAVADRDARVRVRDEAFRDRDRHCPPGRPLTARRRTPARKSRCSGGMPVREAAKRIEAQRDAAERARLAREARVRNSAARHTTMTSEPVACHDGPGLSL